jgi:hypothetical protein
MCVACGRAWPCLDAKDDLLAEYAEVPVALAIYMAAAYFECGRPTGGVRS